MSTPHFEFQTPAVDRRDPQTITLSLCGETLTVDRPKDWTLGQGEAVSDDQLPLKKRGQALGEFVVGCFDEEGMDRLFERSVDNDDPLDLSACLQAVSDMVHRWGEWNDTPNPHEAITIKTTGRNAQVGQPVTVSYPALNLDHVHVEPPKDLLVFLVYAFMVRGSGSGALILVQQIIEATFPRDTSNYLISRLRDRSDPLDVAQVDPMFSQLFEHWMSQMESFEPAEPAPANRAERRAAGGAHAANTGTLTGTLHQ